MPHDPRRTLLDLIAHSDEALEIASGCSGADLHADLLRRRAVERLITILGEAMVRLRDRHPGLYAELEPHHRLIGMRNRLARSYDRVEVEILAATVNEDLEQLRAEAQHLLRGLN